MTTYEREPQVESWWTNRSCPLWAGMTKKMVNRSLNYGGAPYACEGSKCAFWRVTKIGEDGEKHGICTKA